VASKSKIAKALREPKYSSRRESRCRDASRAVVSAVARGPFIANLAFVGFVSVSWLTRV